MVKVMELVWNQVCSKPVGWDEAYALRDQLQRRFLEAGEDLNLRRFGLRNC